MFPNARGLSVTATPIRADGKGLGRHADGVIDTMVSGPDMRWLIDEEFLSGYRIFAPPNNLHLETVPVTAGGDYSPELLRAEVHRSSIHGDVVDHYLRVTPGKLGVTFAVDIESATELAAAYRAAGVPAEVLTGKTPANIRYKLLAMFARGDVKQLCTVDIVSEGFDLPSVEVCSMARPTQSYGLFVQQFGRAIRPLEGKTTAYILDHVGNVLRHGLPDAPRVWSLDRRERRSSSAGPTTVPIRICPACTGAYERFRDACPYCGHRPEPVGRSTPEQVDGNLAELTPEVLARLRGQIAHSEELRIPYNAPPEVEGALRKRHRERLAAQAALRDAMALYGGAQTAAGLTLSEAQRKFYLEFGVDVAHAQMLNATDATALMERMRI
jgi:superfamily II DNA or RNA helicase